MAPTCGSGRAAWIGCWRSAAPDARYVPGHGAVVDAGFVSRQRDWLTMQG